MNGQSFTFARFRHTLCGQTCWSHQRNRTIRKQDFVCFHNSLQHSGLTGTRSAGNNTEQIRCAIDCRRLVLMQFDVRVPLFPKVEGGAKPSRFFLAGFGLSQSKNSLCKVFFHFPVFPQIEIFVCTGQNPFGFEPSNRIIHHIRLDRTFGHIHIQKLSHCFTVSSFGYDNGIVFGS